MALLMPKCEDYGFMVDYEIHIVILLTGMDGRLYQRILSPG